MLNHFALLQYSVILHCYNAQLFLVQRELNHSSLLQWSVIFYCKKGAQSFLVALVLSHFPLLQCSAVLCYYSAHPLLVQKELGHLSLLHVSHFSLQKVLSHSSVL
jgi:hypothetical protein